jgi:hypothetical protein
VTSSQLKLTAALAGAVVLIVGYLHWRSDERAAGAQKVLLAQETARGDSLQKAVAKAAIVASEAELAREDSLAKARALVAATKALAAKNDSLAKVSANERLRAEAVLADSASNLLQTRAELARLVAQSRADSARASEAIAQSGRTILSLMGVVQADSVALTAERSRSAALQALNASTNAKLKLVQQSQPSAFGQFVKLAAVGLVAIEGGRISAGKIP